MQVLMQRSGATIAIRLISRGRGSHQQIAASACTMTRARRSMSAGLGRSFGWPGQHAMRQRRSYVMKCESNFETI